jgi:hypothetical protein
VRPKGGPCISQVPHAGGGIPSVERPTASRSYLLPAATIRPLKSAINRFLRCKKSGRPSGLSVAGGSSSGLPMTNPWTGAAASTGPSPWRAGRFALQRPPIALRSDAIASVISPRRSPSLVRVRTSCSAINAAQQASNAASTYSSTSSPSRSSALVTDARRRGSTWLAGSRLEAGPGPSRDHGSQDRGPTLGPGRQWLSRTHEPTAVGRVRRLVGFGALSAPSFPLCRQPGPVRSALRDSTRGIARVVSRRSGPKDWAASGS